MLTICVDAGTSVIKAVAFDSDGSELAVSRRSVEITRPRPGWSEQDMATVAETVETVIEECAADVARVDALAVTGQGDGCWLVDTVGEPTGPAVLWNDSRAADIVERWRASGVLEAGFVRSGSLTFAGLPNAILAWLREHDPQRLERSAHALTCTGWIIHRLTGVTAIDPSEASNPFFSTAAADYDEYLLDLFDIPWARRLLPDIVSDSTRVAPLTAAAADRTGLRSGIPVVMCPFDVPATTLGLGVTAPGQIACILGTTLSTSAFTTTPPGPGSAGGMTLQGVPPGSYLRVLASLAGTEILDWLTRLLGLEHVGELAELAGTARAGGKIPLLLPYLSPGGERAPFLDTAARGCLSGLTLRHDRADVALAAYAGLSLVVTDCVAAIGTAPTELRVAGGGARSELWCQLLADYCEVPVTCSADQEAGAKGALIIAAAATGAARDAKSAAANLARQSRTVAPRDQTTGLPSHRDFLNARRALQPVWLTGTADADGRGHDGLSASPEMGQLGHTHSMSRST